MKRIKRLIIPVLILSLVFVNFDGVLALGATGSPTIDSSISIMVKKKTTLSISKNGYVIKKIKATSDDASIATVKTKGKKVIITGVSEGKTSVITTEAATKKKTKKTFKLVTKVTVKKRKKPATPSPSPSATPSIEPSPSILPSATPSADPIVVPDGEGSDILQIMNNDGNSGAWTYNTEFSFSKNSIGFAVLRSRITPGTILDGTRNDFYDNFINGEESFSWTIHYADGSSETYDINGYTDKKNGFVQVTHSGIYIKPMPKFEGAVLEYKATVNDKWTEIYGRSTFDLYYSPLHFT